MKTPTKPPDLDALKDLMGGMTKAMETLNHVGHAAYLLQFALKGLLDVANLPESTATSREVEAIARQYNLFEVEASGDYEDLMEAMIVRAGNALKAATALLPAEQPPKPAALDWSLPYGEAIQKYMHTCFRFWFHGFIPGEAEIRRFIEDLRENVADLYGFEPLELSVTPDERDVVKGIHLGRSWTYGAVWNDELLAAYETLAAPQRAKAAP